MCKGKTTDSKANSREIAMRETKIDEFGLTIEMSAQYITITTKVLVKIVKSVQRLTNLTKNTNKNWGHLKIDGN